MYWKSFCFPDVCDEDDDDEDNDDDDDEVVYKDGVGLQGSIRRRPGSKGHGSSGSTGSTDPDSQDTTSEGGPETPVIQSDEEEVQVDTFLFSSTSSVKEEDEEDDHEENDNLAARSS